VAFLDTSKAFDRLVHKGLFLKLLLRGIPLSVLKVIICWYTNMYCRGRWGETYGSWYHVKAGTKQGGVLSPLFYSLYVDDLVVDLIHCGCGCHIRGMFLSCLLYADDMALVAPSVRALQSLLDICSRYCIHWDIKLNPKKSKLMFFGKKFGYIVPVVLNDINLTWEQTWTYLGVDVVSGTCFSCSVKTKLSKFYKSVNHILRVEGVQNELVLLRLAESHSLPILSYGVEVIYVRNINERRQLRVAYNSLFRRIFKIRPFDSVTELQSLLDRPTWEALVQKRTHSFSRSLRESGNSVIHCFL
jgi:hypothetical protein